MSSIPHQGYILLTAVVFALTCAACDSSEPDNSAPADDFTAIINGASSFGGSAFAVESKDPGSGSTSWGITMTDSDTGYQILVAWEAARPSNGTYQVSDTGGSGTFEAIVTFTDLLDQYQGKSGTVTITSSSDSEVSGSLGFSADYNGFQTGSMGNSVNISVQFTASNVVD